MPPTLHSKQRYSSTIPLLYFTVKQLWFLFPANFPNILLINFPYQHRMQSFLPQYFYSTLLCFSRRLIDRFKPTFHPSLQSANPFREQSSILLPHYLNIVQLDRLLRLTPGSRQLIRNTHITHRHSITVSEKYFPVKGLKKCSIEMI